MIVYQRIGLASFFQVISSSIHIKTLNDLEKDLAEYNIGFLIIRTMIYYHSKFIRSGLCFLTSAAETSNFQSEAHFR